MRAAGHPSAMMPTMTAISPMKLLDRMYNSSTSSVDRGERFERFVQSFLQTDPTWSSQFDDVWMWQDWPERPSRDLGVDLVARRRDGGLAAIQCKFYDPRHAVSKADIDSFLSASGRAEFTERIIVSTTNRWGSNAVRAKLNQWFWCGVLGEQYGATIETKLARDVEQVPGWATGESPDIPDTVTRATFAESRLGSLRTRNSAAYKGIYALVMGQERPTKDWMFDRELDLTSYDELQVDIHHVFPYDWCNKNGIDANQRESIINKTPLAKKTNIRLSGDSPAVYMPRIDAKNPSPEHVDATIGTHAIDPAFLRAGDFEGFFKDRRCRLVELVESAMGKAVARDWGDESADSDMPENFVESLEVSDAFEE